jgi:Restriction endonuclease
MATDPEALKEYRERRRLAVKRSTLKHPETLRAYLERTKEQRRLFRLGKAGPASQAARVKRLAYFKAYSKAHPERNTAYYQRVKDTPAFKARVKAINEKTREARLAYFRKYNAARTTEENRLKWHRRRALKKGASINLAGIKEFIRQVKAKKEIRCYYCEKLTPTKGCHFDHIVPLARGGLHAVENLCATCPTCNNTKQNKTIAEWQRLGQQVLPL